MKNIERLANHIAKTGAKNMIIHTIPSTPNWLICQKIDKDSWSISICNPNKYIVHNLGIINNQQHLKLWNELIRAEIETKGNLIKAAQQYRKIIKNFIQREQEYNNILKKDSTKKNN